MREVMYLRLLGGLSFREIGDIMSQTENWARVNYYRGKEKIKKELEERGYQFQSGSDCEVLLPLYEEYGLEMFSHLDAEYACVLYDHKSGKLIAARDQIGIRPLFYGYSKSGKIAFASEAKNLIGWVDEVRAFPPGSYYYDGKLSNMRISQLSMVMCTKILM